MGGGRKLGYCCSESELQLYSCWSYSMRLRSRWSICAFCIMTDYVLIDYCRVDVVFQSLSGQSLFCSAFIYMQWSVVVGSQLPFPNVNKMTRLYHKDGFPKYITWFVGWLLEYLTFPFPLQEFSSSSFSGGRGRGVSNCFGKHIVRNQSF